MAELSAEVSKILEQALALSVEEQEALAESLISNLSGKGVISSRYLRMSSKGLTQPFSHLKCATRSIA
jgi:hypothetical protein